MSDYPCETCNRTDCPYADPRDCRDSAMCLDAPARALPLFDANSANALEASIARLRAETYTRDEQREIDDALARAYHAGDVVRLHGHADGEHGPHASDFEQPARFARVVRVVQHPYNPAWIVEYVVLEDDEHVTIPPGHIARIATPAERDALDAPAKLSEAEAIALGLVDDVYGDA